jgi:hypothetical protein
MAMSQGMTKSKRTRPDSGDASTNASEGRLTCESTSSTYETSHTHLDKASGVGQDTRR